MNGIKLTDRIRYAFQEDTLNFILRMLIVIAYVAGIVFTGIHEDKFAELAETPWTSPIAYALLTHIRPAFLIVGGAGVLFSLVYPFDRKGIEESLRSIGLMNKTGLAPHLLRKRQDRDNPRVTIWTFQNYGIALYIWEDKRLELETALGVTIVGMRYSRECSVSCSTPYPLRTVCRSRSYGRIDTYPRRTLNLYWERAISDV